jgi:hypothetical protein
VINKRNGYIPFGDQLADTNPVMGIMNRIDESTGAISLVVASTTNAYLYIAGSNTFSPLTAVGGSASVFWTGTATGTIVIPTFWPNITPASVTITDGINNLTFDAGGAMNSAPAGIFAAGSTFNFTTGVATINFTGTTANVSLSLTATLAGAYFTGNNTNFFNWVSWQPTDPTTFVSSVSYLYMTNNVDPVTLFDGMNLSRPILYVNSAHTDYITKALDVAVYQNRLLLLRPSLNSTSNPLNQSIYFSALFNPLNFINDVAGNGGQVTAATGDILQCQEFLRNSIIVFFTNSTWLFRFTGSISDPFRFDKLTISKNVSSPYGSIAYDERATAVGSLGLIACDGVNVQRYDNAIIDFYETEMNEQYFGQTFGIRYDNLNQGWMLYVSNGTTNPVVGSGAPGSDSALIYNFAEQSWATYTFSVPMTCMGKFLSVSGKTWADLTQAWSVTDFAWKSYSNQKLAPILLIGDVNGNVYWIDNEDAVTDNGNPIIPEITSTRWNPVLQTGQKTQFAYIDIYYKVVSTDPNDPIQLTLSFYVDNSEDDALQRTLTLDGPIQNGSSIIATGNGGSSYSGTISPGGYIYPDSVNISVVTSSGLESFTDDGSGILVGSLGDTGTINYVTTAWTIVLSSRTVENGVPFQAQYVLNKPEGFAFKRIYLNLFGEFIKMDIDPVFDAPFQILGFIIWARTAGRMTP